MISRWTLKVFAVTFTSALIAEQILLMLAVPDCSPQTATEISTDVGGIRRFKSAQAMSAHHGLVPTCHERVSKLHSEHIARKLRKLSRTIFTQSVSHTAKGKAGEATRSQMSRRGCRTSRFADIPSEQDPVPQDRRQGSPGTEVAGKTFGLVGLRALASR